MNRDLCQPRTDALMAWRRNRRRLTVLLAAFLSGLAVSLAGCGGGSDPGTSTPTSAPAAGGPGSLSAGVAFAQCVRSHGVPGFPDPQNGHFIINGTIHDNPNFQSAVQACQHLLPSGSVSNGSGPNTSAELAFAHCMRTHGVPKFPEPSSNGALTAPAGVNPQSPQFQAAFDKCSSLLPSNGAGLGG